MHGATIKKNTSYCYRQVQSTIVPYIWYDGYAHKCMCTHTHTHTHTYYTLSQVYLATELPVLVSVSLNKQSKPYS